MDYHYSACAAISCHTLCGERSAGHRAPGLQLTNDCMPFSAKPISEFTGTVPLAEPPLQDLVATKG